MFQFYDSPIKRLLTINALAVTNCFNSMIVRLKVVRFKHILPIPAGFNSMIVRLKESTRFGSLKAVCTFQFYDSPIKSLYGGHETG